MMIGVVGTTIVVVVIPDAVVVVTDAAVVVINAVVVLVLPDTATVGAVPASLEGTRKRVNQKCVLLAMQISYR